MRKIKLINCFLLLITVSIIFFSLTPVMGHSGHAEHEDTTLMTIITGILVFIIGAVASYIVIQLLPPDYRTTKMYAGLLGVLAFVVGINIVIFTLIA